MKCHRNASPYRACFASRSCARFSPTISTPASANAPSSSTETYFVATTTVTALPTSSRSRAYRSRSVSDDVANDTLSAGPPVVAAMRDAAVGIARGADVTAVDVLDACGPQCALGRRPEVELSLADDVVAERLAERGR